MAKKNGRRNDALRAVALKRRVKKAAKRLAAGLPITKAQRALLQEHG